MHRLANVRLEIGIDAFQSALHMYRLNSPFQSSTNEPNSINYSMWRSGKLFHLNEVLVCRIISGRCEHHVATEIWKTFGTVNENVFEVIRTREISLLWIICIVVFVIRCNQFCLFCLQCVWSEIKCKLSFQVAFTIGHWQLIRIKIVEKKNDSNIWFKEVFLHRKINIVAFKPFAAKDVPISAYCTLNISLQLLNRLLLNWISEKIAMQ